MGDSDEGKKTGVPSWQLKDQAEPSEDRKESKPESEEPSRATVIEQAKKFLEDEEVRNSSTDKKVAFLEGKGLRSEEIQDLLGVARNTEASKSPIEVCALNPPIHSFTAH
jgi:hypothetical protein